MTPLPLRVALADDEPLARERMERLLRQEGCDIQGVFSNGLELLTWFREGYRPDALFLDIQMPSINGLELLVEIPDPPPTVFVTAYAEHAVRAFDLAAVDYLVKPVLDERLRKSLERLRNRLVPPVNPRQAQNLSVTITERIPVRAGKGHAFLDLRRISHFEVVQNQTWAWSGGKRFPTQWNALKEVEEALPHAELLRIQRHILLRHEAVLALRPLSGGRASVRVPEGIDLEVSRALTPKLRVLLGLV